jgi:hypothetical protein
MKNVTQNEVLTELNSRLDNQFKQISILRSWSTEDLGTRTLPNSWSPLECIEHLLRYGDFYLPEVESSLKSSQARKKELYKAGWLGNYFAKSMLPGSKPMTTFKKMNPSLTQDVRVNALEEFEGQLEQWKRILSDLREKRPSKNKDKHKHQLLDQIATRRHIEGCYLSSRETFKAGSSK